jgi:Na+/H+ antiporter NhaC
VAHISEVLLFTIVAWLALGTVASLYGWQKGYPFFPLFVASTFLGFPVVLLVVAVAAGRDASKERRS